jgi:O-antigen/teichoic acid export membrane protein
MLSGDFECKGIVARRQLQLKDGRNGRAQRSTSHMSPSMRALAATFGATGINMVLSLVTSIVLARCLGPEGRGALLMIVFWPTLILGVVQFSLNEATIYHVARAGVTGDRGSRDRQCACALTLELFAAGAATLASLFILPFIFEGGRVHYLSPALFYAACATPLTVLDLQRRAQWEGRSSWTEFSAPLPACGLRRRAYGIGCLGFNLD